MRKRLDATALALAVTLLGARAQASEQVSNKMLVRTGGGLISNTSIHSSAVTAGGFNVLGQLYFNRYLAAGAGFRADFDFAKGIIPLKGVDIQGRLYFWGDGTQVTEETPAFHRTGRSLFGAYLLGEFSLRSYHFDVSEDQQLTGSTGNVNMGLGIDWALSRHYELNLECSLPVFGFTSDPDNVKLRVLSVMAGIGYVF